MSLPAKILSDEKEFGQQSEVINTSLFDLIEAISDEMSPGDEDLLADVVSHILDTGQISLRANLLQKHSLTKERCKMLPLKKILCPIDFSVPSLEALKVTNELAVQYSAEVIVVHVITEIPTFVDPTISFAFALPIHEMGEDKKMRLQNKVDKMMSKEVKVHCRVIFGNASTQIINVADQKNVDLIVIATHGETGFRRFIFGSVTEKVLRHASCPVLAIQNHEENSLRQHQSEENDGPIRNFG